MILRTCPSLHKKKKKRKEKKLWARQRKAVPSSLESEGLGLYPALPPAKTSGRSLKPAVFLQPRL